VVRLGTIVEPDRSLTPVALRDGELVVLGQSMGSLLAGGVSAINRAIKNSKATHPMDPVKLGPASGNDVVVTGGLAAGDRVVVEGIMKVQPGAVVKVALVGLDGEAAPRSTAAEAAPAGTTAAAPSSKAGS